MCGSQEMLNVFMLIKSQLSWDRQLIAWKSPAVMTDTALLVQTHRYIICPGGWSQMIPQAKKPDVEVLGWRGYAWSADWGRLDVLPNSLKWRWRRLVAEKFTLNYLATALVDIPAVSMPIACSLKTWDICGIVFVKTAHFKVAFYCPKHKVHLCNDHAV